MPPLLPGPGRLARSGTDIWNHPRLDTYKDRPHTAARQKFFIRLHETRSRIALALYCRITFDLVQTARGDPTGLCQESQDAIDALAEQTLEEFADIVKEDGKPLALDMLKRMFGRAARMQRVMRTQRRDVRLVMAGHPTAPDSRYGFPADFLNYQDEPELSQHRLSFDAKEVDLIVHPMMVVYGRMGRGELIVDLNGPPEVFRKAIVLGDRWIERYAQFKELSKEELVAGEAAVKGLQWQHYYLENIREWQQKEKEEAAKAAAKSDAESAAAPDVKMTGWSCT